MELKRIELSIFLHSPLMKSVSGHLFAVLIFASGLPFAGAAQKESASGSDVRKPESREAGTGSADYLLQPQDVLRIQVYQEDEISRQGDSVSISQENTISMPLIGTISLKGKTARQAEKMIRDLYDKDFLVNPQVSVTVTKYAERSVNVFGAVNGAGRKQFPPERGLTILDAISLAGGHSRLANLKKVKLTRNDANGDPVTVTINVDEIMKGGGKDPVQLQPDDVIYVDERLL
jgi:polysaccharide export outer membrane protein